MPRRPQVKLTRIEILHRCRIDLREHDKNRSVVLIISFGTRMSFRFRHFDAGRGISIDKLANYR